MKNFCFLLLSLLTGCQAVPLAVTYAVGAVQTYDIYYHWDDIDCKWVDLEESLKPDICNNGDRMNLPRECYSSNEICSMCIGQSCIDKYCNKNIDIKESLAGVGQNHIPNAGEKVEDAKP